MSNEERLQNIKLLMETGNLIQLRKGKETFNTVNWLIEQAERVQDLEKMNNYLRSLREKNKRLREALEFYGDKSNYIANETSSDGHPMIDNDTGLLARVTLEQFN